VSVESERLRQQTSQADDSDQLVVYLAETTKDLAERRNEIKTELLQFNCRVLPNQPLPSDAADIVDTVQASLRQSKLAVHMLGTHYGAVPESEERSIPRIQYDLARELVRDQNLTQLVWMPEGIVPSDERQQKFLAEVKNNSPEFLQNRIEDLKTEIHKKLAPEAPNVWGANDESAVNLSLFCHQRDMDSVAPLLSYLTLEKFFRVKLPLDEADSIQGHKQLLETSDAVLLYYGTPDDNWFVNIWKLIQRQTSVGRKRPVLAKAIYAAQPPTPEKNLLRSDDPMILRNYGTFSPADLNPLIEKISLAKGGLQ
jgi:hypothetical protein